MKTKTIYQTTAAILAMFVIMLFSFSACSSDDSSDDSETVTFLVKYNGTVWVEEEEEEENPDYLRVINNLNTPLERWHYSSYYECYNRYPIEMIAEDFGYSKITKNTENTFGYISVAHEGDKEYITDYVITINGSSLTKEEKHYDADGDLYLSKTIDYTNSTIDLDSLECED